MELGGEGSKGTVPQNKIDRRGTHSTSVKPLTCRGSLLKNAEAAPLPDWMSPSPGATKRSYTPIATSIGNAYPRRQMSLSVIPLSMIIEPRTMTIKRVQTTREVGGGIRIASATAEDWINEKEATQKA